MNSCIFCRIMEQRSEDPELIVFENAEVFVRVSLRQKPGNHGHVLVMPKRHVCDIYELPPAIDAPLMAALRLAAIAAKEAFAADGIHIRQNNESASGQDVLYLHFHVIPRYHGDEFETKAYEKLELGPRKALAEKLRAAVQNRQK